MPDLRLRYEGNGRFQTLTRLDLSLAADAFKQGEEVAGKVAHARSVRQNNLFHAMVRYAHDNQRAGPELPSWEHLKKWLLIRAGHCSERRMEVPSLAIEDAKAVGVALAYFLRSKDEYVGVAYDLNTGEFIERTAKSVRFAAVMSDEMKELFDKVVGIICTEIVPGVDEDEFVETVKASLKSARARKAA